MQTNRELLSKLKFISKIQPSEKVSLREMRMYPDDMITTLLRTVFRDNSRAKTLSFIQDTIDKAFEIIHNYKRSDKPSDVIMVQYIIGDLRNSKGGLLNLKETYVGDRKFCCDIDIILEGIDARLMEVEPFLTPLPPPLFEYEETP